MYSGIRIVNKISMGHVPTRAQSEVSFAFTDRAHFRVTWVRIYPALPVERISYIYKIVRSSGYILHPVLGSPDLLDNMFPVCMA